MILGMKADRTLQRAAGAQHDAVHRGAFSLALVVLGVLLALVATCAILLQFGLVARASQDFVLVALVCSALALASSTALAWAGFDGLRLARKRVVGSAICDSAAVALCKYKRLKALSVRASVDAKRALTFCEVDRSKIAARLVEAARGLTHICLTPRVLSQRPINARARRAGCLLT
jgi:hypothetical protein